MASSSTSSLGPHASCSRRLSESVCCVLWSRDPARKDTQPAQQQHAACCETCCKDTRVRLLLVAPTQHIHAGQAEGICCAPYTPWGCGGGA